MSRISERSAATSAAASTSNNSGSLPHITLFAHEFVISAGCVLVRFVDPTSLEYPLEFEICVLHQLKKDKDEWVLPKGRKDRGESIETTALRETFEETGYPCEYLPVDLLTRAPIGGLTMGDIPTLAKDSKLEAFAVSIRDSDDKNKKIVWWFLAYVTGERQLNTQMPTESFEAVFIKPDEALKKLSRPSDREATARAIELIRGCPAVTTGPCPSNAV